MAASRRGAGRGAHPHRARLPSPLPAVRHDIFGLFSIVLQRATSHLRSTTLWVASFLLLLLLHLTSPGPSRPLATLGQCVAFLYACGVWRRLTRLWMTASFGRQWRRAMKRAVLDLRCGFAAGLARRGRSCSCRQEQALSAPAAAQAPAQYAHRRGREECSTQLDLQARGCFAARGMTWYMERVPCGRVLFPPPT